MKKIFSAGLLMILLLNSCASILNGKVQDVQLRTKDKKSVVYVDGKKEKTGRTVEVPMKRDAQMKQIRIETEGYKDQYVIHYQNQKSPLYIMSWVPFGILFYPPFLDISPKSFNYKKSLTVKEKLIPISERTEDQKYLFVKNTAFDIDENDFKLRRIAHRNLKKGKLKKFKNEVNNDEDLEFDNSIFTSALNEVLASYKYIDTTATIFKSKSNTAYLSATVKELDIQNVYQVASRRYMTFMQSEIKVEWEMQDIYGQTKFKKLYKAKSGEFAFDYFQENTVLLSIKDAIEASFLKFIEENPNQKFLMKTEISDAPVLDNITLNKGVEVIDVSQALKSTVTVKNKEGHGSGFAVSSDGYIVTNFHVVAGYEDELTVLDNDQNEHKAKLIRKNEELDLALLKIDKQFPSHFLLPDSSQYNVGQEVFVIGTPKSIELGQSLSKGIISGEREKESIKLIQTDASVNGGNSGGPLVSKSGKLFGVVNAKMTGLGVEGIGFAVPAERIKKALYLN